MPSMLPEHLTQCWTPLSAFASLTASSHHLSITREMQTLQKQFLPWVHLQRMKTGSTVTFKISLPIQGLTCCLFMLWRRPRGLTLGSSSCAFPLTTFSLLKFGYLIQFEFTYYLSKFSYFYFMTSFFSLDLRKIQGNRIQRASFLSLVQLYVGIQPTKCQLQIPEPFKIPELGCVLLSFPWMYNLASKQHTMHGNHVEHKRVFCCI